MAENDRSWFALTGGPCSGKTTLTDALAGRGYAVVREAAREVLSEAITGGRTAAQARHDGLAFHEKVIRRNILALERAVPGRPTFFDRTLYDSIAYSRWHGWPVGAALGEAAERRRLARAFMLDPLPWEEDGVRTEDAGFAAAIDPLLEEVYRSFGVPVTRVPVAAPAARVELVLATIDGASP